jgi:hypothetical protein
MPSIRLTLLCLLSAVSAAGCSLFSGAPQGPGTPLSPEEAAFGNLGRPAFTLTGSGTQTFVCTRDKKGRYWRLEHSDVKLSQPGASRVLVRQKTDFTFVSSDGSMLSARVFKWVSGASTGDLKSILFRTRSRGLPGRLTGITRVLRDEARGGQPQTLCSASQTGQEKTIAFTARYRFYRQ